MIRRRDFIGGLGSAAAWPVTVRALANELVDLMPYCTSLADFYVLQDDPHDQL